MIQNALLTAGGEEYLVKQARENASAFLALVGKTLPKDINLAATGNLYLSIHRSCPTPPTSTEAPA
jgi:hypothetical protein